MEEIRRIRVAWLCNVSNEMVREHLPLAQYRLYNFFRRLMGLQPIAYVSRAAWNTNAIAQLTKFDDMEFHIIAPHDGMKRRMFSFCEKNVHYHFFKNGVLAPFDRLDKKIHKDEYIHFTKNRQCVKKFLGEIQPDIIVLAGAENPNYGISILDVKDTPIFLLCQTIYSNPERGRLSGGDVDQLRWDVEQQIFKKINFYACTGKMYYDLIKQYKPEATVFPLSWPSTPFPKLPDIEKKYDFAFFAQNVSVKKGINNAIEALGIVKRTHPDVTMLVVGDCLPSYKAVLEKRIDELGLRENVYFHDFFPLQIDMFKYVKQAKYAVLPIKLDVLSGTVIQAMEMGMPLVTNKTSGTPQLNKYGMAALISEIDDDSALAANMLLLMEEPQLSVELNKNALYFLNIRHKKSAKAAETMYNQIKTILAYHKSGTPIPQEMLYDVE